MENTEYGLLEPDDYQRTVIDLDAQYNVAGMTYDTAIRSYGITLPGIASLFAEYIAGRSNPYPINSKSHTEFTDAMTLGVAVGMEIAENAYPNNQMDLKDILDLPEHDVSDQIEVDFYKALESMCAFGMRLVGSDVEEWIEQRAANLVHDEELRRIVKMGAGVIIVFGHIVQLHRIDMRKTRLLDLENGIRQIESGVMPDWDQGLINLTMPNTER